MPDRQWAEISRQEATVQPTNTDTNADMGPQFQVAKYSDTSANEDNSFRNHIR
jgi:hypothetical protein